MSGVRRRGARRGTPARQNALFSRPLEQALLVNDFSTGNVVFERQAASGPFDLECCYWGPRLLDVANSVLWFSIVETGQEGVAEHEDELDIACAKAPVGGCEMVRPLPDWERRLLSAALRWQIRRWALYDLADVQQPGRWRASEWNHCKGQIELVDACV
ncbi:MAG: phosphotransferase [Candidatus Brocadiae bacterium]|nr:phosphotransferase [Candidatus Brocadiia bacterium]